MNKVHFFNDNDLVALELKINDWLEKNKLIKIIQTNLDSLGSPSGRAGIVNTEKYVFYVLYSENNQDLLTNVAVFEEEIPIETINEHLKTRQMGQ